MENNLAVVPNKSDQDLILDKADLNFYPFNRFRYLYTHGTPYLLSYRDATICISKDMTQDKARLRSVVLMGVWLFMYDFAKATSSNRSKKIRTLSAIQLCLFFLRGKYNATPPDHINSAIKALNMYLSNKRNRRRAVSSSRLNVNDKVVRIFCSANPQDILDKFYVPEEYCAYIVGKTDLISKRYNNKSIKFYNSFGGRHMTEDEAKEFRLELLKHLLSHGTKVYHAFEYAKTTEDAADNMKIPWESLIKEADERRRSNGYNAGYSDYGSGVNKREYEGGVLGPDMVDASSSRICVIVDNSISIRPADLIYTLDQVKRLISDYGATKLRFGYCDTRVTDLGWITDPDQIKYARGGSTNMAAAIEWANTISDRDFDFIVVITDGDTPFPDPSLYPANYVFVVVENGSTSKWAVEASGVPTFFISTDGTAEYL